MKRLRIFFAGLAVLTVSFGLAAPVYAVDASTSVCEGLGQVGQAACTDESGVNSVVATVVSILSWVLGILAVIMVIIGGFKYVTSGGDSNAISSAKKTIMYALVGLVLAALGASIVRFVLNRSTHKPSAPPSAICVADPTKCVP